MPAARPIRSPTVADAAPIRYAKNGDVHLAYQVQGNASRDLLLLVGEFIPIDAWDEQPVLSRAIRRLASFTRLIRCDRRGVGLSDPINRAEPSTLEQSIDDALAVADAAASDRFALMATNEAGPLGVLLAATHPERVGALILFNSYARAVQAIDYPWGLPQDVAAKMVNDTVEPSDDIGWGFDFVLPSMAGDEAFRQWWERAGNRGASPGAARMLLEVYLNIDVRNVLGAIEVPTLVVHRSDNRANAIENGRYLADHIPGAKLVELPGGDDFFWAGDADTLLDEVEEFLTGVRRGLDLDRILATVMFTDVVGSTELAARIGDRAWHDLLDRHHAVVREQLHRFRGVEIDTAGDGFLARFDGPGRAVRCAEQIIDALDRIGISIRAGVHTGECEVVDGKLAGVAVHIGARVAANAGSGELLVSSTVKDLVAGSGIEFADRGLHALKGLDDEWRLFAVVR